MPAIAASAGAEQPDDADHMAHLDADDAGKLRVLADGAHRAADRGAGQQQMHGDHQHDRDGQRQQLVGRCPEAAAERQRDLQRLGEIGRLRGEDEFEQAAQRERGAKARHHHDDDRAAPVAQAAEQQQVDQKGKPAGQRDSDKGGDGQRPAERERADRDKQRSRCRAERAGDRQGEIGAPGEEFAMREIGEAQDRIGQRHADGAEPDHRAADEPVHQRLRVHGRGRRLAREGRVPSRPPRPAGHLPPRGEIGLHRRLRQSSKRAERARGIAASRSPPLWATGFTQVIWPAQFQTLVACMPSASIRRPWSWGRGVCSSSSNRRAWR